MIAIWAFAFFLDQVLTSVKGLYLYCIDCGGVFGGKGVSYRFFSKGSQVLGNNNGHGLESASLFAIDNIALVVPC